MRVVVIEHLSLDGVLQGPGRIDEDPRGGFEHGGWALAAADPSTGAAMGAAMGTDFAWLFGRRSHDDMLAHWNAAGGPFRDGLNATTKYVVSRDPTTPLPWPNSILLAGDAVENVARLRERPGGNLVVMGSGELVRALLGAGLVDEMLLMVHPVVLGSGTRLFGPGDAPIRLRLVDTASTPTGILMTTYRPPTD
ncbi:dihydrofolate reductase family protein [Williamsia herbipolensis]|uniref:dihydrofolate reductase family protein n=1 Tax=Williamsia herbipolensis TaxID=1603258 RepID=UPI0005F7AD82|nr:dihydrofolate reductase family protein [Williamsia herbipolensis]